MKRIRAPGPGHPAIDAVNAALRRVNALIRAQEKRLVLARPGSERAIVRQIETLLSRREALLERWVQVILPSAVKGGAGWSGGAVNQRLMLQVVKAIQRETFAEVAGQTRYIRADVKRLIRDISKQMTELHVGRGMSVDESKKIVANRLENIGLNAFKDASGREWGIDTYAEMLVRTRTAEAYNTGTITQGAAVGIEAFEVFDGTGDPECAEANGLIVSPEWAMANPLAHPNCQRAFGPVPGYAGEIVGVAA